MSHVYRVVHGTQIGEVVGYSGVLPGLEQISCAGDGKSY